MVKIKVNPSLLEQMKEYYASFYLDNCNDNYIFIAQKNDIRITAYESKKVNKTITFIGEGELEEALLWDNSAKKSAKKGKENNLHWVDLNEQIGSDEVGVGDFLLPMIVVATHLKKEDIALMYELGVKDSKALSDTKIRQIGKILVEKIEYSKLTLTNEKYNEMIDQGENLNSLKAKMHNRALLNLVKKYPDVIGVYIDEFVNEKTYYKYLNDTSEEQVKGISFRNKGESLYPSVAAASIIARYSFLLEKEKLENKYQDRKSVV